MSTKTHFKRVALVAVAALGLGVLTSVAPASAATTAGLNNSAGATNASSQAGTLTLATQASVTGAPISLGTATDSRSVGLINVSDIAGGDIAGTTATATMLSTGSLTFYSTLVAQGGANADNQIAVISVTGGTLSSPNVAGTAGATAINGSNTAAVFDASSSVFSIVATPSAGATSMTVRMHTSSSRAASGSAYGATGAAAWATALAAPSLGTLRAQYAVTVASTSTAGVQAASKSGIYYASTSTDGARTSDATSGTWSTKSPASQFANVRVRDIYGTAIASTTGLLQASATNGAIVNITDNTGATGTQSTAFYTGASPDDVMITVNAPRFVALTTVVTVTYNGAVIGTKSFSFTGPISTVTLGTPLLIKKTNTAGSTAQAIGVSFADSAGNVIYPASGNAFYPSSGILTDAASDRTAAVAQLPTSSQAGYLDWSCDASATTDGLILDYVNIDGVVATSNKATVSCAGDAFTYTASYDKASYSPGEVATLTLTFRDSKGNLANDITSWASGTAPSIAVGGGSLAVATTTSDASSLGKKSYSVTTIVTEGTYQTVVKLTGAVTWSSAQTPQIAGFTLKSTSAGVSNADVLKAIVSLIASINKQIAALQKALLRR